MQGASRRRRGPGGVTVLIADPRPTVRAAVAAALDGEPGVTVVDSVGAFDEAIAGLRRHRPHVALLDLAVLGDRRMTGLAALRQAGPSTSVLVMGVVEDPALAHELLRHGAAGRVMKDAPAAELGAAVRAAARGGRHLRIVPSRS